MNLKAFFITMVLSVGLTATSVYAHAQNSVRETEELDFAQGLLSRGMYDMAISQYRKFIAEYPHSASLPEAYLYLGEGYFLSQNFVKAMDIFHQFIQLFPHSDKLPVSVLRLGQIDIEQNKYDEALKELTSIDGQQLKGQMLQSFDFYTAQAYLGKKDMPDALSFFQKAAQVVGASDYSAYAFKEIGKIYAQQAHYQDALDAYNKALTLAADDPLKGELLYRIAEIQFLSGRYPEAVKAFERVIEKYPSLGFDQDALANTLLAYFNMGQYGQVLQVYQQYAKLIKNDVAFFPVHLAAAMAYIELAQYDKANKLLDRMLAFGGLKPWQNARIFIKKADILIRQKNYKDGLALLDAYSSANTDNADENFFLKGQCYFGMGHYDKAFNLFENVYLNFPNSRFYKAALLGEAHCRRQTGRFKEAQALFSKYYDLQDQPDLKAEALYDSIVMDVQTGNVQETIGSAREYLKNFPQGPQYADVLLLLADSLAKNDQPQEAVKWLEGYLSSASVARPNAANFLLGYNFQLLGDTDQALAAYAKVDPAKENGKFYTEAVKNMAVICLEKKNFDQARVFFDRLINQPGSSGLQLQTYVWVCNEYLKRQQYLDVLRVAASAEKQFPAGDLTEISYFKAEAFRALGRCDEAVKEYDLVTASKAKNAFTGSAHIGHGLCLEAQQRFDEAKKEFKKSLDENPDDYTVTAHARFEMANADYAQGNLDEAARLYLLVATIYDDEHYCSQSLLKAAGIFERQHRKADALKAYSEILTKYKNSPAAAAARQKIGLLK
ncbi:MAG: tetratricopeptide repeat protein [Candidatus Omnitrophica bacterium]|nr:tetratricopeptide repeat protein [Candidatus Omnitrophota bacterium]MDE2222877.1 tetratricopeptide repeat protein [Candidatus Omnitrophota bacterium]